MRQRPRHVLADQCIRVVESPRQRGACRFSAEARGRFTQCVAQCHRHIAQPAHMADAPDRAAFGDAQELCLTPAQQVRQRLRVQAGTLVEVGQGAAAGKFVPGADQLAIVATVDAVADQRAQVRRDRAGMLDGQVGDASPRIKPVGRDDRLRGAKVDAGLAAAAVCGRGCAGRQ